MKKMLLSGNEAIALGAFHAGVSVGTGYPGTPSTEILENFSTYPGVSTEWSVNEKVAFEVALGASLAGARSLVTMKHVGLNVAADVLFTAAYTGVKGGLVCACADDPDMNSSQNEQDNRHYAYAAKVPVLEPSDSAEAYAFTKLAFELSEKYDTPVILRTTTRISHSKSVLTVDEKAVPVRSKARFERNIPKYVMIPAHARLRHVEVEKHLKAMAYDCATWGVNRTEFSDRSIGFITSGVVYQYVKEAFPSASVLKLGVLNPLPEKLIRTFASKVKKLYIVEELDPFLEMRIKAMGLKVTGKDIFPVTGELNQDMIRKNVRAGRNVQDAPGAPGAQTAAMRIKEDFPVLAAIKLPPRPPSLCPGCMHRTVFELLNKKGCIVTGDIGCYTLGVLPPFQAMDTCVEMGGSVGMAQGIEMAEGADYAHNVVAVIGDSTFAHSGISGIINAAYNRRTSLVIVLDNGITAMTGMQQNPFSGKTICGDPSPVLDYKKLAEMIGIGPDNYVMVNAFKADEVGSVLDRLMASRKLSLLVVKGPCIIAKSKGIN
jgi:indolepyruvate ferredoxin oxidoreductase, alpha subunit